MLECWSAFHCTHDVWSLRRLRSHFNFRISTVPSYFQYGKWSFQWCDSCWGDWRNVVVCVSRKPEDFIPNKWQFAFGHVIRKNIAGSGAVRGSLASKLGGPRVCFPLAVTLSCWLLLLVLLFNMSTENIFQRPISIRMSYIKCKEGYRSFF